MPLVFIVVVQDALKRIQIIKRISIYCDEIGLNFAYPFWLKFSRPFPFELIIKHFYF